MANQCTWIVYKQMALIELSVLAGGPSCIQSDVILCRSSLSNVGSVNVLDFPQVVIYLQKIPEHANAF
jgi:hypothetical protein